MQQKDCLAVMKRFRSRTLRNETRTPLLNGSVLGPTSPTNRHIDRSMVGLCKNETAAPRVARPPKLLRWCLFPVRSLITPDAGDKIVSGLAAEAARGAS